MNIIFVTFDYYFDSEAASACSDKEDRYFSTNCESYAEGPQADTQNPEHGATCGTPTRKHVFPEQDSGFNMYAPFMNPVVYQLARFFNSAKTCEKKIDQFLKHGILKGLNPTHHIQFRFAYTMYNLVDAAASGPCWHKGTVNYPLQNAVCFRYRNIISVVLYLRRSKACAANMVWRPQCEYDNESNRVYSEIHMGTCLEDTQVS